MAQFTVHTSALFDPKLKRVRRNVSLVVDSSTGLICRVYERPESSDSADASAALSSAPEDVDLRGLFVMPGLVDAHTHVFLHSYDEAGALTQKRDESPTERIVRSVNHCRTALLAGYTTYRDLGSEGMRESDVSLRDAIARGLTPGPRLYVATRVLASTGSYEPRTENHHGANGEVPGDMGTCLPAGCDAVDGAEECRRAVRRRVAAGADVVKFFADYRRRIMRCPPPLGTQHPYVPGVLHPPREPNPDYMVFSRAEMDVIVAEAAMAGMPVAAHCCTLEGAVAAVEAGVDTIEHVYHVSEELYALMADKGTILVPTLAVAEKLHSKRFPQILAQVKRAWDVGVRIACGGDTGTYPHGDNVRELELMIQAGIPVADVLEACTVGGWEACGGNRTGRSFGWFEEGAQADIIGLAGNPEDSVDALRKIEFVMKDATVWKADGKPVGMI